ncbi:rhodanese-like domain-containing protein [Levilactobacillus bambusae]|nr:rhodanese-like domain-containing protein [Levilactobacillus bambusae]
MSTMTVYYYIILIVLVAWAGWRLWTDFQARRAAKYLNNDEFSKGLHDGQIVDLRERKDFNAGHVLGARSMPYSMFKTSYQQLRQDMPVYLYDQGKSLSRRAAVLLKKNGFTEIYILNHGFVRWDGKTKAAK